MASDCSRSWHRSFERIRFRGVHGFRVLRRCYRIYERSIPHEQGHHGPIRVQEGRKGRTTRDQCREVACRSSAEEQRVARQRTATSSSNCSFWRDSTPNAVPGTLPRTVCGCFSCSSTPSRIWSSAGYDATHNGYAPCDGNATPYGYVRCSTAWVYASPTTRVWWPGSPDDASEPDDASPSPSCHAIVNHSSLYRIPQYIVIPQHFLSFAFQGGCLSCYRLRLCYENRFWILFGFVSGARLDLSAASCGTQMTFLKVKGTRTTNRGLRWLGTSWGDSG